MGRFTQILNRNTPRSGRRIREDGGVLNQADALMAGTEVASALGGLFRSPVEFTIPTSSEKLLVVDVPAGYDHFGYARITQVVGATVEAQFLTCTGFTDSGEISVAGLSFDRRQNERGESQSRVVIASSLAGEVQHSATQEFYVPSGGPARAPSNQTSAGAVASFDSTELPAVRYANQSTENAATVRVDLFFREKAV